MARQQDVATAMRVMLRPFAGDLEVRYSACSLALSRCAGRVMG